MYFLRYSTSSEVKRLPPYVLLITRVGGEGERAGGFFLLRTSVDGEAAGVAWDLTLLRPRGFSTVAFSGCVLDGPAVDGPASGM